MHLSEKEEENTIFVYILRIMLRGKINFSMANQLNIIIIYYPETTVIRLLKKQVC